MSNIQATLRSIFGILFIFSITFTAYAQQEQQPAALSQSQFMQIIDRIDKSKEEMREHVDEKFGELDKKFDELSTDVAVLSATLNRIIAIIGATFLIFIIVLLVQIRLSIPIRGGV